MIEMASDEKKIFKIIGDAIVQNEPFQLFVKGEKAKIFKKLMFLEPEYERTKNLFLIFKFFWLQVKISPIWGIKQMAEYQKYSTQISDLENGDVLVSGIPHENHVGV